MEKAPEKARYIRKPYNDLRKRIMTMKFKITIERDQDGRYVAEFSIFRAAYPKEKPWRRL